MHVNVSEIHKPVSGLCYLAAAAMKSSFLHYLMYNAVGKMYTLALYKTIFNIKDLIISLLYLSTLICKCTARATYRATYRAVTQAVTIAKY